MGIGPLISLAGSCIESLLGSIGKPSPTHRGNPATAEGPTFAQILSNQLAHSASTQAAQAALRIATETAPTTLPNTSGNPGVHNR